MSETTNLVWEKQDDGSLAALGGRFRISPRDAGSRYTLTDAAGQRLHKGKLAECKAKAEELNARLAADDTTAPEEVPAEPPQAIPEAVEECSQDAADADGNEPTPAVEQLPQEVQENLKPQDQYDPDEVEFQVLNAAKGSETYMTVLGTVRATTLAGAQAAAAAQFSPPFLVQAPAASTDVPMPTAETSAAPAAEEPKAELQPGQVLVRDYKGAEYRVEVTDNGLMYQGKRYSSLTAVAKAITGYDSINGKAFFMMVGTTKPKQPKAKKLSQREAYTNLLAAAKATLALWDKNGLGDDDEESEPVYTTLAQAIESAEEVLKK
jgi:hypothetical protein